MSSKDFSLIVNLPGKKPLQHDLQGDTILVGRGPDNDIQLLVAEVSVKHGQFQKDGESYKVIDSGSTNGTRVNGKPVDATGVVIRENDKILFGETIATYFVPQAALEGRDLEQVVGELEAKNAQETAPVAVAVSVATGPRPVAPGAAAKPGAAPVPARPAAPAAPGAPRPAAPGAPPAARPAPVPGGAPVRPVAPGATPVKPAAPAAATVKLEQAPRPVAPAGAPRPVAPAGGAPAPVAPKPISKPPAPGAAPVPKPISKPGQ